MMPAMLVQLELLRCFVDQREDFRTGDLRVVDGDLLVVYANDVAFRAGQRLFLNRKKLNFEDFFGLLKWFHEERANERLDVAHRKRRQRRLRGHRETIAEWFDRAALLPLRRCLLRPVKPVRKTTTRVTSLWLVRYRCNDYSVPTEYGHRQVLVKG